MSDPTEARAALRERLMDLPTTHRWPNMKRPGEWYVRLDDALPIMEGLVREAQAGGLQASPAALAALPDDGREQETYARHPFRMGGYLTDPAPDNRCVWRVDGHSPYCGITSADHDDVLARRRAGAWHWAALPDGGREGLREALTTYRRGHDASVTVPRCLCHACETADRALATPPPGAGWEGPCCATCGVLVTEHPDTDACALLDEAAPGAGSSPDLRSAAAEMVQAYIDAEVGNEFNARMEAAWAALRAALAEEPPA